MCTDFYDSFFYRKAGSCHIVRLKLKLYVFNFLTSHIIILLPQLFYIVVAGEKDTTMKMAYRSII